METIFISQTFHGDWMRGSKAKPYKSWKRCVLVKFSLLTFMWDKLEQHLLMKG